MLDGEIRRRVLVMNYAKIRRYDTSNWDGVNTTLFVSGCTFNCPGCFNKEAQDFNYGERFTFAVADKFVEYAKDEHVVGVCILGGEPFQQNLDMLYHLVYRLRKEVKKPIHIWTGYLWEELISDKNKKMILNYCDTLVDGRFDIRKKNLSLKYRGSSNQRVINVKESLKRGYVVEIEGSLI